MEAHAQLAGRGHQVKGGVIAGLVGGLFLSAMMTVMALAQHGDVWVGFKGAGRPFLGERMIQPGFDAVAVLVGFASHLAVSVTWGLLFGLLFYGWSKGMTVVLGALWGIVVWLGMYYVILPLVGLSSVARSVPIGAAIFFHVLFGLVVGIAFLPFQREARLRARPLDRDIPATPR